MNFKVVLLAAAGLAALPPFSVYGQGQNRQTLSERVRQLEQQRQEQSGGSAIDMLDRMNQLQNEIQELRSLVEEQSHLLQRLRDQQKDQYLDLDQRLGLIDNDLRQSTSNLSSNGGFRVPVQTGQQSPRGSSRSVPADSYDLSGDGPAVRKPINAQTSVTGIGQDDPTDVVALYDPAAERALYDRAFSDLRDGRYADSATKFHDFLKRYPAGEYSDNAHYWLGESYYVTRNYRIALEEFQSLLNQFPSSPKIPDALLKIGYSYYELKQWDSSRQVLEQVVSRYPRSTVSKLAETRLKALRLKRR